MSKRTWVGFGVLSVLFLLALLGLPKPAMAAPGWYQIAFTGADIWTYSADNALATPAGQPAPRRYRDWEETVPIQATTYGVSGGTPSTEPHLGFGAWAPTSGFAFDSINLWGKNDAAALAWGEKYVSVPDDAHNGVTSWQVLQSPTGWTSGIVEGNRPYNPGPGAFPVWRSAGATDRLGIANMNDLAYNFMFNVLISNPETAFEDLNGTLRVFFGGYSDDWQGTGPGNHEVSGVMMLHANAIPEPSSLLLIGGALAGLALVTRRKKS